MNYTFSEFIKDAKTSGKDWLKSQLIMSAVTFVLVAVGLLVVDRYIVNVAHPLVIILISFGLAVVDFIPVIGISVCMLPWAALAAIVSSAKLGISIFVVFVIVMIIKQFLEPLIRGKSLGISPIEEVVASVLGYLVCGTNAIGFILGPVVYIIGKKTYTKFTGRELFKKSENGGFFKSSESGKNDNDNVIDISDEVVDVKDDE